MDHGVSVVYYYVCCCRECDSVCGIHYCVMLYRYGQFVCYVVIWSAITYVRMCVAIDKCVDISPAWNRKTEKSRPAPPNLQP